MTTPSSFFFRHILCSEDVRQLREGKLRSLSGQAALRRLWHRQAQLGVTRLSDLTELDVLRIPVFGAVRPTVDKAQITATQGKGLTKVDAVTSALFESLERAAAAADRPRIRASRNELIRDSRYFLDLPEMDQFPDRELEWCEAISMRTGNQVLVAAADTTFPYYAPPPLWRPIRPTTTGFAAGATLAEAVLHALLEVIERDAVSSFIYDSFGRRVLVERASGVEGELAQRFLDEGAELLVFDLTEFAIVPTFLQYQGDHMILACCRTCRWQVRERIQALGWR